MGEDQLRERMPSRRTRIIAKNRTVRTTRFNGVRRIILPSAARAALPPKSAAPPL
jgi:hypothetical protein